MVDKENETNHKTHPIQDYKENGNSGECTASHTYTPIISKRITRCAFGKYGGPESAVACPSVDSSHVSHVTPNKSNSRICSNSNSNPMMQMLKDLLNDVQDYEPGCNHCLKMMSQLINHIEQKHKKNTQSESHRPSTVLSQLTPITINREQSTLNSLTTRLPVPETPITMSHSFDSESESDSDDENPSHPQRKLRVRKPIHYVEQKTNNIDQNPNGNDVDVGLREDPLYIPTRNDDIDLESDYSDSELEDMTEDQDSDYSWQHEFLRTSNCPRSGTVFKHIGKVKQRHVRRMVNRDRRRAKRLLKDLYYPRPWKNIILQRYATRTELKSKINISTVKTMRKRRYKEKHKGTRSNKTEENKIHSTWEQTWVNSF